ncbi:plasma kallikrein-like [Lineus longissimus]|uniref:plasma kallikrein-like n=1 Tax=Lineus longissimus TaxID=88925 RepID=UPI002B4D9310
MWYMLLLLPAVAFAQDTADCFEDFRGVCVKQSVGRCPFRQGGYSWLGCAKDSICCFPSKTTTTKPTITTTTPDPGQGACGHSFVNGAGSYRIVGGWAAQKGEWPWVVSIQIHQEGWDDFMHWCGGAILDDKHIITAAHCFMSPADPSKPAQWKVIVGEHDRYRVDEGEQIMSVEKIMPHTEFNNPPKQHDIAIIKLSSTIQYTKFAQPICLPEKSDLFVGQVCTVAGWGSNNPYELIYSQIPQEVNLPIMKQELCGQYNAPFYYPTSNVCAGFKHGTQDACGGDSGGPLMCMDDSIGRWKLAGVVSWGTGCAWKENPGVYTKVSVYKDWIAAHTG